MIALGVDISTSKLAVGGVREDGTLITAVLKLTASLRGARRLKEVRAVTWAVMDAHRALSALVIVEEPPQPQLRRMAACVMEATQAAIPAADVYGLGPTKWKLEALGRGNASKPECLDFAQALGYEGTDQDVAEALCMAHGAWGRACGISA